MAKRVIPRAEIIDVARDKVSAGQEDNFKLKDGYQQVWAMFHIYTSLLFDMWNNEPKQYWTQRY